MKKYILPPLVPLVLIWILCAWIFISETVNPPRMINGSADDAPRNAAMILTMISPLFFLIFFAINLLDGVIYRFSVSIGVMWTATLAILFAVSLMREPDPSPWPSLTNGLAVAAVLLVPMTLCRYALRPRDPRNNHDTPAPPAPAAEEAPAGEQARQPRP